MLPLFTTFSLQELRHHPWRSAAAVVAVMLGVALAFSVHLINASALSEFSTAVRSVNGQPDMELRAVRGTFDEALFARVAATPGVALASPVLELQAGVDTPAGRKALRVLGLDALVAGTMAPGLVPVPAVDGDRMAIFAADTAFLNPAAQALLRPAGAATAAEGATPAGRPPASTATLRVQAGLQWRVLRIAGTVAAGGAPLAVMDVGAAQDLFGRGGKLTRIDLRLSPGADHGAVLRALALPGDVTAAVPGDAAERVSNLSRAYRVNLTVLALVALFTGAFLVFSVLALSVSRRVQQFALLGVLGLTARQRLALVLGESALLGLAGCLLGVALGTGLAALALRLLGGDLGGGYFPGAAPTLQWDGTAALAYGALGLAAAVVGGWWPARMAQRLPLAPSLKGLGVVSPVARARSGWRALAGPGPRALALMAAGAVLALLPPVAGIPLAAYGSVALLLVGGIAALPWAVGALYDRLAPRVATRPLALLAVERARRVRESAAVAVSGVVASLSLAVALTVMVASFRDSVTHWLDVVLPADLYVRSAAVAGASDAAVLDPAFAQAVARLPGVRRVDTLRTQPLLLDPARPAVTLIARGLDDPAQALPLVGTLHAVPPGRVAVYVSEAVVDLYGVRAGTDWPALSEAFRPAGRTRSAQDTVFFVAGVWRDYARQTGAVTIARGDFEQLTGDRRVSDLALWLAPGASAAAVQADVRELADGANTGSTPGSTASGTAGTVPGSAGGLLEFASVQDIRATSLRIFDRSFAVTYWLQAVAIGIGLFGVAASFSAQVLARRKEFGLLAHLGLTPRQILAVVAGEGAAWTLAGAAAGLALGLAVSVVLVHVVNPQSFHWTMDLAVPWMRLLALCMAVVLAGTLTAWLAGRAAAGRDAVLAVKEDW